MWFISNKTANWLEFFCNAWKILLPTTTISDLSVYNLTCSQLY